MTATEAPQLEKRSDPLARGQFVFLLQLAYSGELGAARAYAGHAHALRKPSEKAGLHKILKDEVHHRRCIRKILAELGSAPDSRRERKLNLVGRSISLFCHVGGWFFPMYGAGKLERQNVGEYEHAARLAWQAGLDAYLELILEMAEVEWDHELFFRTHAASHVLWRVFPHWPALPPREEIRERFAAFTASGERSVELVRAPWIIR